MEAAQPLRSSLHLDQLRTQYLVASDHPSPENLRNRLDEILSKSLPGALSFALSRWFSPNDSSIWFVRQLRIDLDLNLSWDVERIARTWATRLARELSRGLKEGEDGNGVVRFPNRAAYLARFLTDLANGHALGKWYYQPFDGLRMLPLSGAVRTAICDQPGDGLSALLLLNATDFANVIGALNNQDVQRVLDRLADNDLGVNESRAYEMLWQSWTTVAPEPLRAADEARTVLKLYLETHRHDETVCGPTLKAAALALFRLALCLANGSASKNEKLLAALTSGDVAALYTGMGAGDAEVLMPLMSCSRSWLKEVGETLVSSSTGRVAETSAVADGPAGTPFGGIFLLLPLLDALPLERATAGWPHAPNDPGAAALTRFLILVKCFGRERALRVFHDPVVRDLLRIEPSLTPAAVAKWQAKISRTHLEDFLFELAFWQRENGAVRGERLALISVPRRGGATALLLDVERGSWMFASSYRPGQPDRLIERMWEWLSRFDQEANVIFTEPRLAEALRTTPLEGQVFQFDEARDVFAKDEAIEATLRNANNLKDDLSYLSLPEQFHLSRCFDLACSVAAQGMMRSLAWRLPGFARSGFPYLYRNFLDFAGSLEAEQERYLVKLGRPPLNIILGITGMARATYRLSWAADERPLRLFQDV